jgi:hypothetical protein
MNLYSRICRSALVAVGTASVWAAAPAAQADEYYFETGYQPFATQFNQAISRNSGSVFRSQSFVGQLSFFLGISYPWPLKFNAFPEALIADDARRLNEVYQETLLRQVASDPIIRTPDLINPFNTSILTQPSFINNID